VRSKAKQLKTGIITAIITLLIIILPLRGYAVNDYGRGALVLIGNESLAPIVYNDNGTAKGVAVDIAKAIGDRIGCEVIVLTENWEQAQKMVLNGDADGLLQINPNPERNKIYDFSAPLLKSEFSMFVRTGNLTLRRIEDLKNKSVGVEAGGYPSSLLQGYGSVNIVKIYDWNTSFKALSAGELDAIIVDRWIGEYELANSGISNINIVDPPVEIQYSRIAVRKGDTETLDLINAGLKSIADDGTVDEIMEKWHGKRVLYLTEDYFQIFYLHTASIFLFLVALVAIYFVRKYRKLSRKLEVSVNERTEELNKTNEMLKAANLKLEQISMIDGLTSIENRRAFDMVFNKTWEICLREKMPLSLIMADIDNFKLFNDTYGHLAGDQALIKIANVIKNVIKRSSDIAARFGGEEFVVMLMNTTAKGAEVVAEEIRKRVEELGIVNEKSGLTVSLGVASVVPDNDMLPNELIEDADRALYKAKNDGRNKVVVLENQ
jgi:diguanylate cyclase (GGDEF)-like protein